MSTQDVIDGLLGLVVPTHRSIPQDVDLDLELDDDEEDCGIPLETSVPIPRDERLATARVIAARMSPSQSHALATDWQQLSALRRDLATERRQRPDATAETSIAIKVREDNLSGNETAMRARHAALLPR